MSSNEAYAVAVIVVTPQGIPLVWDPKKPSPIYWKFPGGQGDGLEIREDCAVRELEEETGISLSTGQLQLVAQEDRGDHTFFLFQADLLFLPGLKQQGDEGERIKVFKPRQILGMQDFLPGHHRIGRSILAQLF